MNQSPTTLEQLQEIARAWKSAEQATLLCRECGQTSLDALVNSEGQIIDAVCSNCNHRIED